MRKLISSIHGTRRNKFEFPGPVRFRPANAEKEQTDITRIQTPNVCSNF